MKKIIYIILGSIVMTACKTAEPNEEIQLTTADTTVILKPDSVQQLGEVKDTIDHDHATYFVIVADTSFDYNALHKKMNTISKQLSSAIDTMGRFYNKTKKMIVLPDTDEDEMYAGQYFPRRFPSSDLSLEYLNFYQKTARENTIALVAGIFENEHSADSAMVLLQQIERKAFKIKADIFIGCMH